jgi:hypothetical protein
VDKIYDAQFLSHVTTMVKSCSRNITPLDADSLHLFMFPNGRICDFRRPLDQQIGMGCEELRISRCAAWPFEEWWEHERRTNSRSKEDAKAQEQKVVDFVRDYRAWVKGGKEYDDESFEPLRERFVQLMPDNPAIDKTFYASAGARAEKVPMALYNLCQIAEALSGFRAGLDENVTWFGKSGNNGKGTIRAHVDFICGQNNNVGHRGYACSLTGVSLQNHDTCTGPKQELSNTKGCRVCWGDDLDLSKPLNSSTVRNLSTSANYFSADAKHKETDMWQPNGLLAMPTNELHAYQPHLKSSDIRRQSVVTFPVSFKAASDPEYDPANVNHVLLDASVRDDPGKFAPNLFFWIRCLAGVSRERSPRPSILLPRPPEVREETQNVSVAAVNPDEEKLKAWATDHLREVAAGTSKRQGEACSSAPEIEKKAMAHLLGRALMLGEDCARAKDCLRSFLLYTAGKINIANTAVVGGYKRVNGGLEKHLKLC